MKTKHLKETRDDFYRDRKAELDALDAEIARAQAGMEEGSAEARAKAESDLRGFQELRARAEDALSDLKNAGEDAWEDMKTGIEKGWAELKNSARKLSNRIR